MTRLRCDACGYTWSISAPVPAPDDEERETDADDEGLEELPEEDASAQCPSCGAEVHAAH